MGRVVPVSLGVVPPPGLVGAPGLALQAETAAWRRAMRDESFAQRWHEMSLDERAEYEHQSHARGDGAYFSPELPALPTSPGGIVLPLAQELPASDAFDVKKAAIMGLAGLAALGAAGYALAAPPSGIQGVISSAANNHGLQGTDWHTTVWAEQDAVAQAMLTLCATNNASPADESDCQQFPLYQGRVLTLENAWSGFRAPPPGGLLWKVDGISPDQLALFSRTYTLAPEGKPGTLGSANPGLLVSNLPLVGTSQFVPAAMRDGFRTNVGFLNATALPSDVLVRLHTGGGNVVAQQTFSMPGFGWQQLTDIFGTLGVAPFKNGYVEVIQMTGERLGVYVSNIDGKSGNPTTFPAKTVYAGQRSLFVPSAAHLNGYNATTWITDVNYLNEGPTGSLGGLAFLPYDQDNTLAQPIQQTFQMGNGEMRTFPDVLLNEFALTGVKGSLTWGTPDGNPHLLWASTFNDRGAEGTFGQATPSIFGDTDKLSGDLEGILVGLSQAAVGDDNNGYRSAIGLLNTGATAAVFHVDLSDDAGNVLGSLDENVPAMSLLQLDKVYQLVTPNAVNNGRAVVKVTSGQGFAYASLIDNQNGAPTTQYATRRGPDAVYEMTAQLLYTDAQNNSWVSTGTTRDTQTMVKLFNDSNLAQFVGGKYAWWNNALQYQQLNDIINRINTLTPSQLETMFGDDYNKWLKPALDDADGDGFHDDTMYNNQDFPYDNGTSAPGNDPNGATVAIQVIDFHRVQ